MSDQTEPKNMTFTPLLTMKANITCNGIWYEKKLAKEWLLLTPQQRVDHEYALEAEYMETVVKLQRLRAERACVLHINHYYALMTGHTNAARNRPVIGTPSLVWVEADLYNKK